MSAALTAGDVCTRDVVVADRRMPLTDAARLMRDQHVGALVVVDDTERGRLVAGVLTDRDIVTAVIAKDLDARLLRAGDVMCTEVATTRESDSVLDVLAIMRRKGVRRVPVTGLRGELLGLVALDDVLELLAEELKGAVDTVARQRVRERSLRP